MGPKFRRTRETAILLVGKVKALLIKANLAFHPFLNAMVSRITPKSALTGLNLMLTTSAENVRERLENDTDRPDMMSYVLAYDEANLSQSMSEEEMVANSLAIVIARSDTVTTALAASINELLQKPQKSKILGHKTRS